MSFEKQVQIYSYTLTLLNLTLRVKFPCKVYLEHQGRSITAEVTPTASNKFIFNQEVSLKNQTDKQHIQIVVQLMTEKGNKYVGGVVRLVESDLVASEGQCMAVPVSKCLDAEALCELRVDQVATSRVVKKGSPKKAPLRSQYHPDPNLLYSSQRPRAQENETKSQFNFPISIARKERQDRSKDRLGVGNFGKLAFRGGESRVDKEAVGSMAGGPAPSALQFEVYKEGYNKLKDKYRKQTQNARSEMNKRLALENSENNLKLQAMRYKLKSEELEKTVTEKNLKIKQLTDVITALQKKELDSKYLKEEVQNKSYSIKSLQETIKSLNRDNNELKALQTQRFQSEQEIIQSLRDEVEKVKKGWESREGELLRELKAKNEQVSKLEYSLHNRTEQLERAKCNIEDLDKAITNKTFEWEKVLQSERNAFKIKQDELKQKITSLQSQRGELSQQITQLQQALQDKKGEISKLEYDKKVIIQNSEVLIKENQELKSIKERYIELTREHKIVNDDKSQLEKNKEREAKIKDAEIFDLNEKLRTLTESNRRSVKELQEKLKANQLKLIENQSQSQSLRNQLDRFKRQFQTATKDSNDLRNQLKDCRADVKTKEETILLLTTQLTNASSKTNQGEQTAKLEITRLRQEVEKLSKALAEEKSQSKQCADTISELQLTANKSKMEWQFREDKALKELGYSKEKVASLEAFRTDLESQIATFLSAISNLKANEKMLSQKIQRLELQAIKTKENSEKLKKDIKILEEKLQNNDTSLKGRLKELSQLQLIKEKTDKRVAELDADATGLRNELSQQIIEKQRYQKIGQILQGDLAKAKEEQSRLNTIIGEKDTGEVVLREQLKKEKEEYTKLDMRLNALRKQFQKFKETLVDNLNTIFSSIPEGLNSPTRQMRSTVTDKSSTKENGEVLSLLMGLGREARLNMTRTVDQLKQTIRDNEKLNSDYSTSMNKSSTTEFQFSQTITQLQEDMAELLDEKTKDQNKYEEEIFLLEGRLKEKDATINDLTEQLEELDFLLKNTKTEFELHRQESQKKDSAKNKLIEELREQVEYQCAEMENLQHSIQKYQQSLEASELELATTIQTVQRLSKDLGQAKDNISQLDENVSSLKKQLKRAIERGEELSMGVAHKQEELRKIQQNLQEEERKSSQLREFLKGLMRQKEEIIKNELQKSEKVLELETSLQELKHEFDSLEEAYKKSKILQQDQKETIKKLTKSLKDEQTAKLEEKARGNKLADRLKDKEKEITAKDDIISKLEDRLKKQADKKAKDVKELQAQLDQTYQKLLTAQRQSCQQILALENLNEKYTSQNQKLTESLISTEESLFKEKTKNEELRERLAATEKTLSDSEHEAKGLSSKIQSLNEQLRMGEEESFKLQGKINLLQMKFQMKENEGRDSLQNLNDDWSSKYYSMEEEYEQRLELAEKERDFLKEKLAESDKEVKKLASDLRTQETAITSIKKNCEDKVKSLEEDRLAAIAQKNTENQRLVDEVRTSFDALKLKESECRKVSSQLELLRANLAKVEGRWKEGEEKIRSLNRSYQSETEEMRKKEQTFKRLKQNLTSSLWKAERQVRKLIQNNARQVIELVDEKNTIRVMEVSRVLEQSVLAAISFKLDEKEA